MHDADHREFTVLVDRPRGARGEQTGGRDLVGNGTRFMRRASASRLGKISTDAGDRGYLLGVSQCSGHVRRIYHQHHSCICAFAEESFFLRNLSEAYRADFTGPFDFLLMEMSLSFLQRLADEEGYGAVDLRCSAGETDQVLSHMFRAVAPALERGAEASAVFLDQLGIAIATYLIERHSDAPRSDRTFKALLSSSQLSRAKELLREHLDGAISITDVARVCGLSRGYFIRAFRQTTGQTPHHWLLGQRVACARNLLVRSDLPLAEVALASGFSDQSHFTRIFSKITRTTPGSFRRAVRV